MQYVESTERYILILLTKFPDRMSRTIRFVWRLQYTHASIGLDGADGKFYSFVTKGFRIENPAKYPTIRKQEVPCELYRIPVTETIYREVQRVLDEFASSSADYSYNFVGMILCLLKISRGTRNSYFCSQFVAEVLRRAEVLPMRKDSSLYTPDDFLRIGDTHLLFRGTLRSLSPTLNLAK